MLEVCFGVARSEDPMELLFNNFSAFFASSRAKEKTVNAVINKMTTKLRSDKILFIYMPVGLQRNIFNFKIRQSVSFKYSRS